jgi:hypothetical protein
MEILFIHFNLIKKKVTKFSSKEITKESCKLCRNERHFGERGGKLIP